jgi:hypothetical protein
LCEISIGKNISSKTNDLCLPRVKEKIMDREIYAEDRATVLSLRKNIGDNNTAKLVRDTYKICDDKGLNLADCFRKEFKEKAFELYKIDIDTMSIL